MQKSRNHLRTCSAKMIMRKGKILVALFAVTLGVGCTCSLSKSIQDRQWESCRDVDADILLEVVWSMPSLEFVETNTLGFRTKDPKDHLWRGESQGGLMQSRHGGTRSWSLSNDISTNGVNLTLKCKWSDSTSSSETNTSIFVPFTGDLSSATNEMVKRVKWITDKSPNKTTQTIGSEAVPQSGR